MYKFVIVIRIIRREEVRLRVQILRLVHRERTDHDHREGRILNMF